MAKQIITNTVVLSAYSLIVSFPFPVILALMLNYCVSKRFGKVVQTVTYMPYFISVMVLVGMMNIFFSHKLRSGEYGTEGAGNGGIYLYVQ